MIKIMNLRREKPSKPYDVCVDRTSVLGNPNYMPSELYRDEVCDIYDVSFETRLNHNKRMREEMDRLIKLYKKHGKLRLFCWCAPKRCHIKTIKKYILERIEND